MIVLRRLNPIVTRMLVDLREKLAPFYSEIGRPSIEQISGVRMDTDYTILGAQIGPGASTASLVQSGSGVVSQGLLTTAFNEGWVVIQNTCSYRASSDVTPHVVGAASGTHEYR